MKKRLLLGLFTAAAVTLPIGVVSYTIYKSVTFNNGVSGESVDIDKNPNTIPKHLNAWLKSNWFHYNKVDTKDLYSWEYHRDQKGLSIKIYYVYESGAAGVASYKESKYDLDNLAKQLGKYEWTKDKEV